MPKDRCRSCSCARPTASIARDAGSSATSRSSQRDRYIFVFEDIRGRYESEGQFVMQRAPAHRKDPNAIDESTDSYDTIDWLRETSAQQQRPCGELGISYDGWTTVMSMLDPHPALKAVSPQASPVDMFIGDDFHHNGAFRLSYGFEYASSMETTKGPGPIQFRHLRHLHLVSRDSARCPTSIRQVSARADPIVGRLRQSPELR